MEIYLHWNLAGCLTLWGRDKMVATLADDIFKCLFLNENFWISNNISLKCVPWGLIDMSSLVQIMPWCGIGDKPLSEPIMFCLWMHTCVPRSQWVKLAHMENKNIHIAYNQCHDCWCPGDTRSQGIRNHGICIELDRMDYCSFSIRMVIADKI